MTPESLVTEALRILCWRAGVAPDDDSLAGALRVCAVLQRDHVTGSPVDAESCPIANWFRAATGLPRLLVSTGRVIVMLPRELSRARCVWVELPPAVRAAIRLIAERRVAGLLSEVA